MSAKQVIDKDELLTIIDEEIRQWNVLLERKGGFKTELEDRDDIWVSYRGSILGLQTLKKAIWRGEDERTEDN